MIASCGRSLFHQNSVRFGLLGEQATRDARQQPCHTLAVCHPFITSRIELNRSQVDTQAYNENVVAFKHVDFRVVNQLTFGLCHHASVTFNADTRDIARDV